MANRFNYIIEPEAIKLLKKYEISYPKNIFVRLKENITGIADKLNYPVVMKIVSSDIIHKSDAGGVITNINNEEELKKSYHKILNSVRKYNPNADIKGVLLCNQAEEGQEVIIGTLIDDIFGPSIMFGLGGIFVEILKDVTFRICPVDKKEALKMIEEIKGYDVLKGLRGKPSLDINGLAELISKVSIIAVKNEKIKEIDLNPVRVYKNKIEVLDVRILTI